MRDNGIPYDWVLSQNVAYITTTCFFFIAFLSITIQGLVIWWKPEWHIVDPLLTLCFSGLVLSSITGVIRSSMAVLLEETPANISWQDVHDKISALPNVFDVHVRPPKNAEPHTQYNKRNRAHPLVFFLGFADFALAQCLHIWCISQDQTALSLHCTSCDKHAIENINKVCRGFGITHTTIQVNQGNCATCSSCDDRLSSSQRNICDQVQ